MEILREWVIQETEFKTKAMETIQGLTGKHETRSSLREVFHFLFGKSSSGFGSELQTKHKICKLFGKSHGIWTCSVFKGMEVSERW